MTDLALQQQAKIYIEHDFVLYRPCQESYMFTYSYPRPFLWLTGMFSAS